MIREARVTQDPYLILEAEILDNARAIPAEVNSPLLQFRALATTWAFLSPNLPPETATKFQDFQDVGAFSGYFAFQLPA